MPLRVQGMDPNYEQRKQSSETAADLRGDHGTLFAGMGQPEADLDPGEAPPTSRDENGYKLARQWTLESGIELNQREEQRLALAFARVQARDGASLDKPSNSQSLVLEPIEFSSVDYARMMIVDASVQRTAAEVLEMDVMDRQMTLSWANPDLENKPWFQAGVSPTEFASLTESQLQEVASGHFDELGPHQREGVELMLLRGGSMRDEGLDKDLLRTNEKSFLVHIKEYEFGADADLKKLSERCNRMDDDRFGPMPNRGGITTKELSGLVERLEFARKHDRVAPIGSRRPEGLPINPRMSVRQEDTELSKLVVREVMHGKVRSRLDVAARAALEYQQEQGVPLNRAAFQRMERAVARMAKDNRGNEMPDAQRVQRLLVDTSIQAMADEKLRRPRLLGAAERVSPSEQIATDIVGKGSVPIFTSAMVERNDLGEAAAGRFQHLSDDRGIASAVRIAFHRSEREVGGEIGERIQGLIKANPVGKEPDKHWVEEKANSLNGASKLRSLTRGPDADIVQAPRTAGMAR